MGAPLRDVTALVLTVGEPTLPRALAALDGQRRPAGRRVIIEHVDGFGEAFGLGVTHVSTDLMLQCDADMILDPDCLATLHAAMRDDAALCLGRLADPLLGPIEGIKLFRTAALRRCPLEPGLTAETDQVARFRAAGYSVIHAVRGTGPNGPPGDVLGRHEPAYDDPEYIWHRFLRLGRKARRRRRPQTFRRFLTGLRTSPHPAAELALIALCHGFLREDPAARHDRRTDDPDLRLLLSALRERD